MNKRQTVRPLSERVRASVREVKRVEERATARRAAAACEVRVWEAEPK